MGAKKAEKLEEEMAMKSVYESSWNEERNKYLSDTEIILSVKKYVYTMWLYISNERKSHWKEADFVSPMWNISEKWS